MKENVNFFRFCDNFSDTYKDNFSYEGKQTLYNYLISLEEDTGEEIECDIVALCCDYSEYDDLKDLQASYPDIKSLDDLRDNTTVIEIDGTGKFIIQNY